MVASVFIVTKAISFFKIFIHSKGHSLLDFSLMMSRDKAKHGI